MLSFPLFFFPVLLLISRGSYCVSWIYCWCLISAVYIVDVNILCPFRNFIYQLMLYCFMVTKQRKTCLAHTIQVTCQTGWWWCINIQERIVWEVWLTAYQGLAKYTHIMCFHSYSLSLMLPGPDTGFSFLLFLTNIGKIEAAQGCSWIY